MTLLALALSILIVLGSFYTFFSILCVHRFFREEELEEDQVNSRSPSISVLKAIKGLDSSCVENLSSFCRQDYPRYEVLFGFGDANDPAVPYAEMIAAAAPCEARVVIRKGGSGANQKVLNLQSLADESRYQVLALSDSDMVVDARYLRRIAGEFRAGERTGIVTSLYKISEPSSLGSGLESLTIALDFIPSVLVARRLEGVTFGLGASIAVSKDALQDIGGLGDIADYLADDYQLGYRLWKKGYTNILSRNVIENRVGHMSIREHLKHQLRWARTYRASRPFGFFGYGITHLSFFSFVLLGLCPGLPTAFVAAFALTMRYALGIVLYRKVIRSRKWLPFLVLLPVKDVTAFVVWLWSFAGSRVHWRGADYRVTLGGRIIRVGE